MSVFPHTLRSASLFGYFDVAKQFGLNPALLLKETGIDRASLEQDEMPISVQAACHLLELSAARANLETFGLQMAKRRRLSNLGLIGVVLREEPTGLAMLESLCRYLKLANPALNTRVERSKTVLIIREDLLLPPSEPKRQATELIMGVLYRVLSDIMGDHWRPNSICFQHSAPNQLSEHQLFFKSKLLFNMPFNGIQCHFNDFEQQLPNTDADSVYYLRLKLDRALTEHNPSAAEQVCKLIHVLLPTKRCRLKHIANHMGVTTRTIHRQLANENTSFNQLLTQTRKQMIMQQLSRAQFNATQLSELLGFASLPVFSHWFAAHYGISASQWHAQLHSQLNDQLNDPLIVQSRSNPEKTPLKIPTP